MLETLIYYLIWSFVWLNAIALILAALGSGFRNLRSRKKGKPTANTPTDLERSPLADLISKARAAGTIST